MANYVLTPAAVRKLNRLVRHNSGNTGAENYPSPVSLDGFPPPFTVRWSASENNRNGKWAIWLPDRSKLVMYSDAFVSSISGVTAATVLPSGWYTIDDAQANSTTAYLVVTVQDSTGVASAELSVSAGQATTGTTVYNILVATMATDATSGAKRVKQYVDSTVTLGAGSGVTPDDVSTEFIPQPAGGATPDGDEGKLQIKGFKAGTPADNNNIANYLMGAANIPTDMCMLCRWTDSDGAHLVYLPIAQLYQNTSGQSPTDMTVEYIGDIDWYVNGSTHQLRKRIKVLNLRTGGITDKAGTTYANGWEVAANTTAITSIPRS